MDKRIALFYAKFIEELYKKYPTLSLLEIDNLVLDVKEVYK